MCTASKNSLQQKSMHMTNRVKNKVDESRAGRVGSAF
jgi:hypothetical protein